MTLAAILFAAGCGSGAASMAVTLSTGATQALDQGQTVNITATVANDTAAKGVTWVLTSGPGALSNTSATAATYSANGAAGAAVITATSVSDSTKTAVLTITVTAAPAITTTSLPAGVEGTAYSQAIAKTGGAGTVTFTVSAGTLPPGLTLSAAGTISGTPTGPNGTSNFTVKATDSSTVTPQTATQALSILINLPPAPGINPATLPGGNVGTPYNQSVSVTGGLGPYAWSISSGTRPAGVNFTPGTTSATLSGIPTTAATYTFTVMVTDSSNPPQSASVPYTVVIGGILPLSITTTSLPGGAYNTAYGPVAITATGGYAPYSFGATGLPAGLTLSSAGSLSGTPTAAGSFSVTITVTDSNTPTAGTANKTLPLTITAAPLVLTPGTGNLPTATQNAPYTTSLTPSGGVGPYSISLDSTSTALPSALTFNSTSATTAAATITGTPAAVGTTSGIIVDVTDSESPAVTQKFTYSLTVDLPCGSGSESLLNGQYALALQGFDSTGKVALVGGVLTADGAGNLTAGALDMNLSAGVTNLAVASGSKYKIGSDSRGCMSIVTTSGTQNYRFSLSASGIGHMINFDTTGPFTTGVLRKQTPAAFSNAQISGNYAFGVASPQDTAQGGGKFAAAGVFNFSGAGAVTGGAVDYNLYNATTNIDTLDGVVNAAAWPASPISISNGGSYNITGNGRGTLSFTPSGSSTVNAYIYVVSATELLVISSDARTTNSLFAGSAMQQSGGPFANTSLNGKSVIYNSQNSSGGSSINSSISIGIVTTTGASATFSYAGYSNSGGNISTPTKSNASGTFSVAANGRVTLTATGQNQLPEFYLISPNKEFAVFSGTGPDSGLMEAQTSTSVSGTYAYGSIFPQAAGEKDSTGAPVFTSGNVTGTGDDNAQGTLSPNSPISDTYSVDASGVVFIPASCTPGTTCKKIGTVITSSKFVMMDAKSSSSQSGTTTPSMSVVDK
jgi:large repetitive protein